MNQIRKFIETFDFSVFNLPEISNSNRQFLKSKYFYFSIGLTVGYGALFFMRRYVQGHYFDYKADLSIKDLNGKTVLITGGNSGVGLGSAIHFAKLNANVIIACRNDNKAEKAVNYIKKKSGNENVKSMQLDLSDLASVQSFALKINKNDKMEIDYLILNAGIMSIENNKLTTKDGLSSMFQINYLSHWYLTNLLLNKIKQTADNRWYETSNKINKYGPPVRIVSVSSESHLNADIPLDNDDEWDKFIKKDCKYGQSKLLQIVHMKQLQNELNGYEQQIQCVSVSPGFCRTSLIEKYVSSFGVFGYLMWIGYPFYRYIAKDIMSGSQVIMHACCNDEIINCGYYRNCRLKNSGGVNDCSDNHEIWKQVWNRSDLLIRTLIANN